MTEYAGSLPSLTPGMVDQVFQKVQLHLLQTEGESDDLAARIQEGVRIALQALWSDLGADAVKPEIRLTARQYQVVKLMAEQNLQYKQIAAALQLGVSTIRSHINNVYKKLPPTKRNRGYVAKIFLEGKVCLQVSGSTTSRPKGGEYHSEKAASQGAEEEAVLRSTAKGAPQGHHASASREASQAC